jgi:hypothetical protein
MNYTALYCEDALSLLSCKEGNNIDNLEHICDVNLTVDMELSGNVNINDIN